MDTETLIRERAYLLWEQSGCPHGQSEAFWLRAVAEIEAAQAAGPIPPSAGAATAAPVAEKAAVRRKAATTVAARTGTDPVNGAVAKVVARTVAKMGAKTAANAGASASSAGMLSS